MSGEKRKRRGCAAGAAGFEASLLVDRFAGSTLTLPLLLKNVRESTRRARSTISHRNYYLTHPQIDATHTTRHPQHSIGARIARARKHLDPKNPTLFTDARAPPMKGGWRGPGGADYPSATLPSALDEPPQQQQLSAPLLTPSSLPAAAAALPPASASAPALASFRLPAYDADPASPFAADLAVATARVRNQFVAKVFGLLLVQLLVVAAVALATPRRIAASPALLAGSSAGGLAIVLVLSCSEAARRAHPFNVILLAAFSAAQGLLVASATRGLGSRVVLDAVLATALAVAALCAFAFWRAEGARVEAVADEAASGGRRKGADFAATEGMLLAGLVCLLLVTGARVALPALFASRPVDLLVSGCAALLFCAYISWDIERLLTDDGGRGLCLGPDDVVLAVLTIEVDVINLFLYVLDLLRAVEGGDDGR